MTDRRTPAAYTGQLTKTIAPPSFDPMVPEEVEGHELNEETLLGPTLGDLQIGNEPPEPAPEPTPEPAPEPPEPTPEPTPEPAPEPAQ